MTAEITLLILAEMFHFVVHWLQSFGVMIFVNHGFKIQIFERTLGPRT